MNNTTVEHEGIVKEVNNGVAKVSLLNISSCSSCVVKSVCGVSDVDDKELEVDCKHIQLSIGERIKVIYDNSMGPKAMMLGYLFPFVLLFLVLLVTWEITGDELISSGVALSALVPYYFLIWIFRERLKQTFSFKVRKMKFSS